LSPAARFQHPDGSSIPLHGTPPLLLRARLNRADGSHREVNVVTAGFTPVDEAGAVAGHGWKTASEELRSRRSAQARDLAAQLARLQQADPQAGLVVLGAFDALDFDDGHEDAMANLTRRDGQPMDSSVGAAGAMDLPLTNLLGLLPADERYTAVREGDAQAREHILVNQALLDARWPLGVDAARLDADFGIDNFGDYRVPVRVTGHDALILYLGDH
jgi:uncharacterized protein